MREIVLIGGGGHCKSCIDVIESENKYKIEGILDLKEKIGQRILSYPIIGTDDDILNLANQGKTFFISIGQIMTAFRRTELYLFLKQNNIILPVIISPNSYVSESAKIGEGTIIMHHALINADVIIGSNCIINSKALIEHDVKIGDNCHIATGAILNGGVEVGNSTFFGSGSVSVQNARIPENSFIKANSLFIR
jgi:sugar O-acyltransferase (sialic acid O-acetyltransferase NeuD family)